ncbi:NmrA family NAD(P)-binding protein [Pontibacter vulgaris]|uniref:NmrA family NAD(P)-binding protein n=1 Tax=Pontibacter vulgaris TaxID=2905679 RepID=UPI001FA7A465|nr:NmrA family NAD(P)-binding protein [Pontibacter vulgaris]
MSSENYILILGATGNIGGKIAQELILKNAMIGVAGRSRQKLATFAGKAELLEGDFNEDAFLQQAFFKATSLFLTVPDDALATPAVTAQRLINLIQSSPIRHVVNISNCITEKYGQPTRLVAFEQELNKMGSINLLHLRCANFFENLHWGLHTPYKPDLALPYISSYEVASVAATYLLNRDFSGNSVKELMGPRDYTMAELAAAAGEEYVQLPYTDNNRHFYKGFNDGDFKVTPRTASNTSPLSENRFTLEYFLTHDFVQSVN